MLATHNDHPRYVKYVVGCIYVFPPPILVLGGSVGVCPKGLVHNLPMQFSTPCTSTIKVSGARIFDIVATQKDHPSYVKRVLGDIDVFFTLFRGLVCVCVCVCG